MMTFENSPNPISCFFQAMQTQEKVFYCFYNITLVLLKIVTSQLCLHTLMQTYLSANQSAHGIIGPVHMEVGDPGKVRYPALVG